MPLLCPICASSTRALSPVPFCIMIHSTAQPRAKRRPAQLRAFAPSYHVSSRSSSSCLYLQNNDNKPSQVLDQFTKHLVQNISVSSPWFLSAHHCLVPCFLTPPGCLPLRSSWSNNVHEHE